jgi:hypothetical protein
MSSLRDKLSVFRSFGLSAYSFKANADGFCTLQSASFSDLARLEVDQI